MQTRLPGPIPLDHDGDALAPYLRVTWDGSALNAADGSTVGVGTLDSRVLSGAAKGAVLPWGVGGARKVVCAGAVAKGASLKAAAGGKVDDSGATALGLVALEAGSGDGSVIQAMEVLVS